MAESAESFLDAWAKSTGRIPQPPELPVVEPPRADVLYRASPDGLCIPGHDDAQEGDPDRNALPLDEMMVLSIMALGVLEPIMVYRRPDTTFEVIAGRRRTRHAREANKRLVLLGEAPIKVPVVVKAARISREMASVIDTTLNEHRENDPPSVKIRKAAKLLARGIDISTVAVAYRVTVATIKHWIEAATAHPIVGAALDARIVTIDAVAALSSMTHEEQPRALDQLLARPEARPALVRAVRDRKPLPGRVPRGAVRWILAEPGAFSEDFIRGVKFMKGELSEEEVRAIMAKIGR